MLAVRSCEDLDECAHIWQNFWPQHCIFDLWDVRKSFASCFDNKPYFLIAEESRKTMGLLALSWVEETQSYVHFPGETWQAKTWLEQNKIPAKSNQVLRALLKSVPGPLHLRYLNSDCMPEGSFPLAIDETGYLFMPAQYEYSFDKYMQEFSGKSRKNIYREITKLASKGIEYRYNHFEDIDWMFQRNIESFGEFSYFSDDRFLTSYKNLVSWLFANHLLRITTVKLGGTIAAVDIGTVWNNDYTVLAGGTNPEFAGVAKMINLHHIEWACHQRLNVVDFLCGDFGWKNRFHLTNRPLFEIYRHSAAAHLNESQSRSSKAGL